MTIYQRNDIIEAVIERSRLPCPEIVPVHHFRNKITGETHSPFGMPFNYQRSDYETVLMGFGYRDKDGAIFGTRGQSAEQLLENWTAKQNAQAAKFRIDLESMSDERIASQADYWLKTSAP